MQTLVGDVGYTESNLGAVQTRKLFCENTHVLHRFGRPSTQILKTQCLKMHFFENGSQGGRKRY